MAFSTLTITLTDGSEQTLTLPTSSADEARTAAQFIARNKGLWCDSGIWVPSTAILIVQIS